VTDYKNAGNYEFNYVKAKNGNDVELLYLLERNYDIQDGKVQMVRVPYYDNLTTTTPLTCLPWDGTRGGVLVFNVGNTLQLNGNIDVSGRGFKGGLGFNTQLGFTNCFQNDYKYPLGNSNAANKGESFVVLPNSIAFGKGPAAAGGGSGVDHNSGGGGGGNGGIGGFGGYQYETCGGGPFDNRGLGGKFIPYSGAQNKIFLGSGGGAGHSNNTVNINFPSSGGSGGGLVIISAQRLISNSNKIISNGENAPTYLPSGNITAHEAMGGGGAGGTILLNVSQIVDNTNIDIKGGKGADMTGNSPLYGKIGPGGGGGGGVFWSSDAILPATITVDNTGGGRGVLIQDLNNPWGTTVGQPGINVFGLQMKIDDIPYKPNIDSVRIKLTPVSCSSLDFEGLAYVNTHPIVNWQWYFGDGATAATQNSSHTYIDRGSYTVKLVITDLNGCKDSITKEVLVDLLNFRYEMDVCDPLKLSFFAIDANTTNPSWDFGDGNTVADNPTVVHTYATEGDYLVEYSVSNAVCTDTLRTMIKVGAVWENIILTPDTTICFNTTKQLRSVPSLDFCWTPSTYLDNPNSPNPVTSTPHDITYYLNALVSGTNLITNGDFSQGNTGFISGYAYDPSTGEDPGFYTVAANVQVWHPGMAPCGDHTAGTGNMMMINGAQQNGTIVWSQTITVQPGTNYAFSTWLQHITSLNPAALQFSINGLPVGNIFNANNTSCIWDQFYTTWNSGSATSAEISIVNRNQVFSGNDFALDDISFAAVTVRRDSVKITVDTAVVKTNMDTTVCAMSPVSLTAIGAQTYTWTPATGVDNTTIYNPIVTVGNSTQYVVEGVNANGCVAKDTVNIGIFPAPSINVTPDSLICKNTTIELSASGGVAYLWSPAATLSDETVANPLASPTANTKYYLTITDINACTYEDSVQLSIRPDPVFTVSASTRICYNDTIQLHASGGDLYLWEPGDGLDDPGIHNPSVSPSESTTYTVTIQETTCNNSAVLTTNIQVLPLPKVTASRSTDVDCSVAFSQLSATGAMTYSWSPAASLSNASLRNPVARPRVTTEYIVKGTSAAGCSNSDTVVVEFKNINKGGYLMPNAFTPNNDGLNDCYGIKYWGFIDEIEFSIYNRWGERIFYTKDAGGCWDGTYKGVKQDPGVFVYMVRARTSCESDFVFRKGTFALIR
jgi:gliding motility-associated-like protein